jgi:cytochrome c oxidase subunit 2
VPLRKLCAACALGVGVLALAGCGGKDENSLAPASHQAHDIANLFWWMMGVAWVGLGSVVFLLVWAWRRNRRGFGDDREGVQPGERTAWKVVIGAGVALPIVLIAALFVVADIFVIKTTQAPAANATKLTVLVVGHQWWWEVHYAGTTVVTANEIHIPAQTPVRVEVQTADVIHSFWVPELNRTIDTIPGRTNAIELYADKAGLYRGQCDEFCGLQHAHMAFYVFADTPAAFQRWLAGQEKQAAAPTSAATRTGEQEFTHGSCSTCHTIRGTSAAGNTGPDLTHLASRTTLGALAVPNTPSYLEGWIRDSQHVKPGNQMPNFDLDPARMHALVAYLETLK